MPTIFDLLEVVGTYSETVGENAIKRT
jgi:hypothetical protein